MASNVVYVGKKNSIWKAIKFLLLAALVCYLVTKIYQKVVAKKKAAAADAEELDLDLDLDMDELEGDAIVTLDDEA